MDVKALTKAMFWGLVTMATIIYQGILHNYVLQKMYPEWWFYSVFTAFDIVIGFSFGASIVVSFRTRARITAIQSGFQEARLKTTHTICDVTIPVINWTIYILVLIVKVAFIFYGYDQVHPDFLGDKKMSDDVQWATLLTAAVFFLETIANSNAVKVVDHLRDAFLVTGAAIILMDLFDTTNILDLWFNGSYDEISNVRHLRMAAIFFHCLSLVFPLPAIVQIMRSRYGVGELEKNFDMWYTILRLFMFNVPYLVLRSFPAHHQYTVSDHINFQTKALLAKNCYAILCAFTEILRARNRGREEVLESV